MPQALAEREEPFEDSRWLWDAFWRLNRCRPVVMGPGPIPLSEIESYVRLFGVPDVARFVDAVDQLDRVYLEVEARKFEQRASRDRKAAGARPGRGR